MRNSWSLVISGAPELFETRKFWAEKEKEPLIGEPGQPHPLPLSLREEAFNYRVSFICPRESACLKLTIANKWDGFSCFLCGFNRGEFIPVPIDKDNPKNNTKISRRRRTKRFKNEHSIFDFCDCGRPKLKDKEGCIKCLDLNGLSRSF